MARCVAGCGRVLRLLLLLGLAFPTLGRPATLTVQTNRLGPTPSLLGYNLGHFLPGSNTRDWWRYSGVTGARIFLSPSDIEPSDDAKPTGDGVTDQASFLARTNALRANPLNTNYINWAYFSNHYAGDIGGIVPSFALGELRRLGIRVCTQITASQSRLPITGASDWAGKWELWQHYYAQAFYLGRVFDVERFQMYNEPNHPNANGLTQDDYLQRLQLSSDAIQSALTDVNRLYGKALQPRILAPVTSGSADGSYPGWGDVVVTNRHSNFLGQTSTNFWLTRVYDYHQYNSTPSSFGSAVATLNGLLAGDMAPEPPFPVSISEFNVHTAATFDTLAETLDSPTKYSRFGAIVVNLAKNSCDELYCFKFSQTLNGATVKKNGMHYVDNTNAPFNIGTVTKAGEVWRLFNKAFAPGRELAEVTADAGAASLDVLASYNGAARLLQLLSVNNTTTDIALAVNLGAWGIPTNNYALIEEVSESRSGGGKLWTNVGAAQLVGGTQPANSVWLLSIHAQPQGAPQSVLATDDATVSDGGNKNLNLGSATNMVVRNNSTNTSLRSAAFLKFRLPKFYPPDLQSALLTVRASSLNGAALVQAHVYGLTNNAWSQGAIKWSNAPSLAQGVAAGLDYDNKYLTGVGDSALLLGQLVADNTPSERTIDVTEFVRSQPRADISFLLARLVGFYGDAQDNDGLSLVSTEGSSTNGPRLRLALLQDGDGDGLSDEAERTVFGTDPLLADTDGDGVSDGDEVLVSQTNPRLPNTNAPPLLSPVADRTVIAGTTLLLTNTAVDPDPRPQTLRFALLSGPTNATLDPISGVLTWRPAFGQAGTTNLLTITVTENGWAYSLTPVADASVRDGSYAAENYGTNTTLEVKLGSAGFARESYLRFDRSGLVGELATAQLRLLPQAADAAGTHALSYVTSDDWTETGLTWNNRPDSEAPSVTWLPQAGVPMLLSLASLPAGAWSNHFQLSLRLSATNKTSNGYVTYGSREAGGDAAPHLILRTTNTTALSATQTVRVVVTAPRPPILETPSVTNGIWLMSVAGDTGLTYSIQDSTNLAAWRTVFTTNPPTLPFLWSTQAATNVPAQFYRVRLEP